MGNDFLISNMLNLICYQRQKKSRVLLNIILVISDHCLVRVKLIDFGNRVVERGILAGERMYL